MNNDAISKFTLQDNTKFLLKRNLKLSLLIFILADIYYLCDIIDTYLFVMKNNPERKFSTHFIYTYRIHPAINIIEFTIVVISYKYFYNAYTYLAGNPGEENSTAFNKANHSINISLVLKVISLSIISASILYRLLFVR